MVESVLPIEKTAPVAILFGPDAVPVVDIFRALGDFEDHYDVAALDQLEANLTRTMGREAAKSVVSDALLLAFGLRRERREPLHYAPLRSRRGTLDEYRLMALVGATYWHDFGLASDAAASLDVLHAQPLVSLASDIARRLEAAGVKVEMPDFRVVRQPGSVSPVEVRRDQILSEDLKLSFDV
jgi:hypothetical protein